MDAGQAARNLSPMSRFQSRAVDCVDFGQRLGREIRKKFSEFLSPLSMQAALVAATLKFTASLKTADQLCGQSFVPVQHPCGQQGTHRLKGKVRLATKIFRSGFLFSLRSFALSFLWEMGFLN